MTQPRQGLERDRQDPRGNRPPAAGLPEGYLRNGYFDAKGNVLPSVIQEWPMQLAQSFKNGGLKSTQQRRFFNKAKAIEQKLKSGKDFDRLKEEIRALKPLAASAVGRGNAPELFKRFMELNVDKAVESEEAFTRGFISHFQSIVAYTKYLEEQPKSGKGGR